MGAGARLHDGCVVGKPLALGRHSRAPREEPEPARARRRARWWARARWCWPARVIGAGSVVGDQAHVRERAEIGARAWSAAAWRWRTTCGSARACGSRRTPTSRPVGGRGRRVRRPRGSSRPTTTRRPAQAAEEARGAVLRRACRIGGGAVLLPGIEVGEEAFVAAGRGRDARRARARGGDGRARRASCARCRRTELLLRRSPPAARAERPRPRPRVALWAPPRRVGRAAVVAVARRSARVWRRGRRPPPQRGADSLLLAAEEAVARDRPGGARRGYREGSTGENALFNLLSAFVITFLAARWHHLLLRGRRVGPLRNVRVGRRHIHHFVPGIVIAFASGAGGDLHARRRARAEARDAVRRRDGADARRVGAAARAGGRLLDPRGARERADHARRCRAARRRRARPAACARRAQRGGATSWSGRATASAD